MLMDVGTLGVEQTVTQWEKFHILQFKLKKDFWLDIAATSKVFGMTGGHGLMVFVELI